MKGDRELCMAAVAQNWQALGYASEEMKKDAKVLLAAVQKLGLKIANTDMNDERTLTMAAVKQKGQALRVVSEEMKGDRELCMAAVTQDWQALQYASEEMKRDRDFAMAMFQGSEFGFGAFEHVPSELKHDEEVVLATLKANLKRWPGDKGNKHELFVWPHIPEELKQNPRVRSAAGF